MGPSPVRSSMLHRVNRQSHTPDWRRRGMESELRRSRPEGIEARRRAGEWDGTARRAAGPDPNRCDLVVPCPTPTGPQQIPVEVNAPGLRLSSTALRDLRPAITAIAPATVFVRAFTGNNLSGWSGSGVLVDPQQAMPGLQLPTGSYLVLTNHHVASGAKGLTVTLADGTELEAEVLRSAKGNAAVMDQITDSALLVVRSPVLLATARLGEPAALEQGDTVLTAGHPMGLPRLSVTTGIVSNPRQNTGFKPFPVIQFDAAINGGNSGGPLVDAAGRVIGLNTFTLRDSDDMSFAIPVTEQLAVLRTLHAQGAYLRTTLDLTLSPLPLYLRRLREFPVGYGAEITGVGKLAVGGTPLQVGDVLTDLRSVSGETLAVRLNSPFDRTTIDGWLHRQPPFLPMTLVFYRQVDVDGRKTWRRFETLVIPNVLQAAADAPIAHIAPWERSSRLALAA